MKKIIAIVILAPIFWIGWLYIKEKDYRSALQEDNQVENDTQDQPEIISERESTIALFSDVVSWTDPGFGANFDVEIRDCENGTKHNPDLGVYTMNYEASRGSTGGYNISEVTEAIPKIQELLETNGWQKCSGFDEPGFYQQTTYQKNGKLLGLNWGTRDAVIGGSYISIQFEFND